MGFSIDMTGARIDRYQITGRLGKGGMGAVYEAEHVALQQRVAIKVLHARFAHEERYRERFLREARSASRIRHRNVVRITDFGETPEGSVYFVMELLEGRDLRAEIREVGRMPWERVKPILLQAAEGLAAAHARDVIHRDVKPANCFLSTEDGVDDFVKLVDFGIAKIGSESQVDAQGKGLTGTGEVFGTVAYMSPEQAAGRELDARSDMYSLGVMAYEMLVGRVPFTGVNSVHVITRHMNEAPEPLRTHVPSIPEAVESLVLKTLEKKRDDRYESMKELVAAMRAIPDAMRPVRSRTTKSWKGTEAEARRRGGMLGTEPTVEARDAVDVPVKRRRRAESSTAVVASPVSRKVPRSSRGGEEPRRRTPGGGRATAGAMGSPGGEESKAGISVVDTTPKALAGSGPEGRANAAAPVRRKRTIPAGGLVPPASVPWPPRAHGPVGTASPVAAALAAEQRNAEAPATNGAAGGGPEGRRSGATIPAGMDHGTVWGDRGPSRPPVANGGVAAPGERGAPFAPPGVPSPVAPTGSADGPSLGSGSRAGVGTRATGSDPSVPPGYVDSSVPPPGARDPSFPSPLWGNEPSSTGPLPRRGDSTTEMSPQGLSSDEPSAITARTVAIVGVLVILVSGLSTLATALFLSMQDEPEASRLPASEPLRRELGAEVEEEVAVLGMGVLGRSSGLGVDVEEAIDEEGREDLLEEPVMHGETAPERSAGTEPEATTDLRAGAKPEADAAEPEADAAEPEADAAEPEANAAGPEADEAEPADTEDEIVLEDDEPVEEPTPRKGARPSRNPDSPKCKQLRAETAERLSKRDWSAVLASTNAKGCWAGAYRVERLQHRVRALLEVKRLEDCVSAGRRSRDPVVQGYVSSCRRAQAR